VRWRRPGGRRLEFRPWSGIGSAADGDTLGAKTHAAAAFSEPHASSESTDMMVKASVQFEEIDILGRHLGLFVRLVALRAAPSSPSRSRRSCRRWYSVAADEARIRTGRALTSGERGGAQHHRRGARSHTGELSSRFTGSAIILAAQKSSAPYTAVRNKA